MSDADLAALEARLVRQIEVKPVDDEPAISEGVMADTNTSALLDLNREERARRQAQSAALG